LALGKGSTGGQVRGDSRMQTMTVDTTAEPVYRSSVTDPRRGHELHKVLGALVAYSLVSAVIWSNVWTTNPSSVTTCGCGDTSLFTWFLEWPAYAISHGLNPLHSTAAGYPGGVNLLANTSELALGVVLAPITWLFGPIASLNVALTLSPAMSAFAMFILLRRWTTRWPAAFAGGLLYGFSPFILSSLADAHLMLGMAVVPPLIVLCLDELLVRQTWHPLATGAMLALLVTLQFFVGTEVLLIEALMAIIGIALVVIFAAWRDPAALRSHFRYAITGLIAGSIITVVVLAVPAWYALDGPTHLSGSIWPGNPSVFMGPPLRDYIIPQPLTASFDSYLGPRALTASTQYMGIGLLVVLIAGLVVWRRDRRLWLFGGLSVISMGFTLGSIPHHLSPWSPLGSLPLFQNILPYRFVLITYLVFAIMLGLIIDHTIVYVAGRTESSQSSSDSNSGQGFSIPSWAPNASGVVVALIALLPLAAYLAPTIPIRTERVVLPLWFRPTAGHLNDHEVILVLPSSSSGFEDSAMTWQAVDRMAFDMIGVAGPTDAPNRIPKSDQLGMATLNAATDFTPPATHLITAGTIRATRSTMDHLGVTTVVIPAKVNLPPYDRVQSVPTAAMLITAATGSAPRYEDESWVWTGLGSAGPSIVPTETIVASCAAGATSADKATVIQSIQCILGHSAEDSPT
jgi:hypothetical protein